MPALKGSLTYVRAFVRGQLPSDLHERFARAIRLRAMKPLAPEEDVLERSGWCAVGDPFDLELSDDKVFYDRYVNLGFRTDKWSISGPMLRAALREAESAQLSRKGRERLSRKERAELKKFVAIKLRKKLPPVTRASDVSWSLDDGLVRFFSHAEKSILGMTDLFERTFELELVHEAPYTLASRLGLSKAEDAAWERLEPTLLVPGDS